MCIQHTICAVSTQYVQSAHNMCTQDTICTVSTQYVHSGHNMYSQHTICAVRIQYVHSGQNMRFKKISTRVAMIVKVAGQAVSIGNPTNLIKRVVAVNPPVDQAD
jgi:hypothetical protein